MNYLQVVPLGVNRIGRFEKIPVPLLRYAAVRRIVSLRTSF